MIVRGATSPTGWTEYECNKCCSLWHVHAHEGPKKITRHSAKECAAEVRAQAELVVLRAKHPGRAFSRSVFRPGESDGKLWYMV